MSVYVPIITITGQLEDFLGNNAVNATVSVRLRNFGSDNPRVPGSCIITTPWVPVTLNGTGGFSFTPIGNDVITPTNTYYEVRFASDNANTAVLTVPYQFTGTGSQDLSQIIPFSQPNGGGGPSVSNLVVKNPTALQTIVGFGLSVPQIQDLTAPLLPHAAGGTDIGSTALPVANVYVGGAATNNNKITSASATAARTFTLPDANSNPVQPLGGATAHQWVAYIDSAGVLHTSQPGFSDISGTASSGQYVAMVGDSGSGGVQGAVPAPPSGSAAASKFLKADGTWAAGGSSYTVVSKSTNYVAVSGDEVWCTGSITITLPAASATARVKVVNRGTGSITVTPASGTIIGNASMVLDGQYSSVELSSDGTNWTVE